VIGVVLLAIAGLLVLAGGRPVPPGRSAYDAGATDPVAAAVPVLAGYVEQARGLRFHQPPLVRVADGATIAREAAELTTADSDAARSPTGRWASPPGRGRLHRPRRTATGSMRLSYGRAGRWTRRPGSRSCTR
jgi:hypothetical protein